MEKGDARSENGNRGHEDCFTNADRIRQFHQVMGVTLPAQPIVPDAATLALRYRLIQEEFAEVTAAYQKLLLIVDQGQPTDITPFIHELTDLLYVTYGAIQACGVDPDQVFAEVHAANMRKQNGPIRADGKRLKPAGWQPADVKGVIERLGE